MSILKQSEAEPTSTTRSTATHKQARRIHILFVLDVLPAQLGGGERTLLKLIRLLPKDRYRCSLVTLRQDPAFCTPLDGVDRFELMPLTKTYDGNALRQALRLVRFIRDQQVDLAHTFFESSDIWAGTIAKLFGRIPVISSRRDMGILRSGKHRQAYRLLRGIPDKVIAVADEVRNFCIETDGLPQHRVVTVYNGVPPPRMLTQHEVAALREQLGMPRSAKLILQVGNVRKVKGMDILAHAASMVIRHHPETVFLVAGGVLEQDYFKQLQRQIAEDGLANQFRCLGPRTDITDLLQVADVFVLPSRSEGFSNAIIEAMACGKPVVASHVGGNGEAVVDGQTGLLFAMEDVQVLAQHLIWMLDHPEAAASMGEQGKRRAAAKFSDEAMLAAHMAIYEELVPV